MERSSKLQLHVDMVTRLHLVIQQLELRFWYFAIPLIRESSLVAFFIHTFVVISDPSVHKFVKRGAIYILTGLLIGFSAGVLLQLFTA
jgi:hypothetical protein